MTSFGVADTYATRTVRLGALNLTSHWESVWSYAPLSLGAITVSANWGVGRVVAVTSAVNEVASVDLTWVIVLDTSSMDGRQGCGDGNGFDLHVDSLSVFWSLI